MKKFYGFHLIFGATGLLIFIIQEILRFSSVDINVHDTYLVISSWHVSLIVCFIFMFWAFVYYAFSKLSRPLGKKLAWFHYILSTFSVLLFFLLPYLLNNEPKRYVAVEHEMTNLEWVNLLATASAFLFVLAQLLFLINIGITIFKKKI